MLVCHLQVSSCKRLTQGPNDARQFKQRKLNTNHLQFNHQQK
uniref:Uncharacterized protein n=1 Tax=Anguilla anguilla TaxID=7936 RepID=A0A0E9XQ93_ANGAN